MEMEKHIYNFVQIIYENYGRFGCFGIVIIIIAVFILGFYFLNKLPEPKVIIIHSICISCKYKRRAPNRMTQDCPLFEESYGHQSKSLHCPIEKIRNLKYKCQQNNTNSVRNGDYQPIPGDKKDI